MEIENDNSSEKIQKLEEIDVEEQMESLDLPVAFNTTKNHKVDSNSKAWGVLYRRNRKYVRRIRGKGRGRGHIMGVGSDRSHKTQTTNN